MVSKTSSQPWFSSVKLVQKPRPTTSGACLSWSSQCPIWDRSTTVEKEEHIVLFFSQMFYIGKKSSILLQALGPLFKSMTDTTPNVWTNQEMYTLHAKHIIPLLLFLSSLWTWDKINRETAYNHNFLSEPESIVKRFRTSQDSEALISKVHL